MKTQEICVSMCCVLLHTLCSPLDNIDICWMELGKHGHQQAPGTRSNMDAGDVPQTLSCYCSCAVSANGTFIFNLVSKGDQLKIKLNSLKFPKINRVVFVFLNDVSFSWLGEDVEHFLQAIKIMISAV